MKKVISILLLLCTNMLIAYEPTLIELKPDLIKQTRAPETCKVIAEVAEALTAIEQELETMGLGLKIFEAYCVECEETCIITAEGTNLPLPDECNRHCRGTSVDVTLVDQDGNELDMGTPFDEFGEKAHPNYKDLEDLVLQNRLMLRSIMLKHGFVQSDLVWWHFDIQGWENYELICCPESEA